MKTLTLKIKIGDEEELAPFIFDSDLNLGRVNAQVLVLKYFLQQNVDPNLYVGQGECDRPLTFEEGPYFDKKTRFVLSKYQELEENKQRIISFIQNKLTTEERATGASSGYGQAQSIYRDQMGTMSLATLACMHGYADNGDNPAVPIFTNRTYTSDDRYISETPELAPPSALYQATEYILNLINDVALGEYEFEQASSATRDIGKSNNPSAPAAGDKSLDYFQRPDPNTLGIDDIVSGIKDKYFDLGNNRVGLFIPSGDPPQESFTLASPPMLDPVGWDAHSLAAKKRALKEVLIQVHELDISNYILFRADFSNDIYQALFPELDEFTQITGPLLTYSNQIIRTKDEFHPDRIEFESESVDLFYDNVVTFLDSFSGPGDLPLIEYLGFTTPSFRPGAIYKDEFVFNARKLKFLKDSSTTARAGLVLPNPGLEAARRAAELEIPLPPVSAEDENTSLQDQLDRDLNDFCIENEISNYFNSEGAIKSVVRMTERELKENVQEIIERTNKDIEREYAVQQAKESRDELISEPSNFDSRKAGKPGWLLGGQASASARGSAGFRSEGQNDVGTVNPLSAPWPNNLPPRAKPYNPEEITGTSSDFKSKIKKVVKIFKKAQKELEEFEEGDDKKVMVPNIDLNKEAKKLEDFQGLLENARVFWERQPQFSGSPSDIYFKITTRQSTKKEGYLEIKRIHAYPYKGAEQGLTLASTETTTSQLLQIEDIWKPSYTIGYLAALDQIISYHNTKNMALGGCFSFLKPAKTVSMVQQFTVPRPFFRSNELSEEWPPMTGPFKTASDQAKDQFNNYILSFEKSLDKWSDQYKAKLDARDPIPNFSDEFNKVCNLEKLYAKVLDKLNIGALICQVLKCMGLWPVGIDLNLALVLPKIPKLPTFDMLGQLGKIIYKAIIKVLAQTLCKLVQTILDLLKLDCRGPDINTGDRPDYGDGINQLPQGLVAMAKAATDIGLPEALYDDSKQFVDDLSSLLSPSEICSLYQGQGSSTVFQIATNLIKRRYNSDSEEPSLSDYLLDPDDMAVFFAKLGVLGASEICETLQDALEQTGTSDFDVPDDCACIDGEQLRDKLLRDKYANSAGVSTQAMEEALNRAKRNKELAKKAFEDLAQGKMLERAVPDLADFSNPSSPLFDIPSSFKGLLKTAVEGTLEAVKSQYYNDIRLYVPYMYSEQIKLQSDPQTAPGVNKLMESRKLSTVETLRNYNFWLSIIRPEDFDPSQIDKRRINQLYALYCLLYPVYKERYIAKIEGSDPFYLNPAISNKQTIEAARSDFENLELETMEKVIELFPSPYSSPFRSQDYPNAIAPEPSEPEANNFIDNARIAMEYNSYISPRTALQSFGLIRKVRQNLQAPAAPRQGERWNISDDLNCIQMYSFYTNDVTQGDNGWIQLDVTQEFFRSPIIVGFSPPDLRAMHDEDEVDGETIPFGFTKTFNVESYMEDRLDKSEFLKTELLKKISERILALTSDLADLFAASQSSSSLTSGGGGGATQVINEFLPKIKPLFEKEREIRREINLQTNSRLAPEVVEVGATPGSITLQAPAKLSNLAELMLSRIENDQTYRNLYNKIETQSKGDMHFSFGSSDENFRQINSIFTIKQDPHYLKKYYDGEEFTLNSCKVIPTSLMSDNELNSYYYQDDLLFTPGDNLSNAVNLHNGMILAGSKNMFQKHGLPLVNNQSADPFSWITNSYNYSLESYFEDSFDQIFDSPFISNEDYISTIRRKLTGTPYVKEEEDQSGCSLEQKGYEPVKILVDFDREIEAALSRVIKRMREPGVFRDIDFKKPSPFENGIRDTVILLFTKILMYEFALRAGPAMSAFKATEVLSHDFVVQFMVKWIMDYEIYNLRFFKKNPGLRDAFKKALIDTTGQPTPEEALRLILSQELPDVASRVDKLFDSFVTDSPAAFMQRLPYGSVFNVQSIRPASWSHVSTNQISAGRKFLDLSLALPGTIERDYASFSATGQEQLFGSGSLYSPAFDYSKKGGFILESYVRITGPMAREYQRFFFQFEAIQEELQTVIEEAGDDLSAQASVDVDLSRIDRDTMDSQLKDEIIVSLAEFRDYLQGDVIQPLLDNLGFDLQQLGYSEDCGLRPKFTEGYPSVPIKITRRHTTIDSRHIDWLHNPTSDDRRIFRSIDLRSFEEIWDRWAGTPIHSADNTFVESTKEKNRAPYQNYYILPKNLCPFLNTPEKEQSLAEATLRENLIAPRFMQTRTGAYKDLVKSNLPFTDNYNFDFNFFSRKIKNESKEERSKDGFSFTVPNRIDENRLTFNMTQPDESTYNVAAPVFHPAEDTTFENPDVIRSYLENAEVYSNYTDDEITTLIKPVLNKMDSTIAQSIKFDNLVTPSKEEYEELMNSLSYSKDNSETYLPLDDRMSNLLKSYPASMGFSMDANRWTNRVEQKFGNSYQDWSQYVVDVVGFAAPMLDVGETFHHKDDLPEFNDHLQKIVKIADGFQFWKKYLSSNNTFFQKAQQPEYVEVYGAGDWRPSGPFVEGQKRFQDLFRIKETSQHPDQMLSHQLNPNNLLQYIFSQDESRDRFHTSMGFLGNTRGWGQDVTTPMPAAYYGPNHPYTLVSKADLEASVADDGQPHVPYSADWLTSFFAMHHRDLDNVSTGMLNVSENADNTSGHIFKKKTNVNNTCLDDLVDDQAAFFMSTFDKKQDGKIKMSRPLGVTPVFFSSKDAAWSVPMADQSWTELRAYTPDIHIDFKWTYKLQESEDLSRPAGFNQRDEMSFSDDHMFNSCLKVIYPDETKLLKRRTYLQQNITNKIYNPPEGFGFRDVIPFSKNSITKDMAGDDNPAIRLKWQQYYNRFDTRYRYSGLGDRRNSTKPITPLSAGGYYTNNTSCELDNLFQQWPKERWSGDIYQSKQSKTKVSSTMILNMEGSFYNYNLARRYSTSNKVREAVDAEIRKWKQLKVHLADDSSELVDGEYRQGENGQFVPKNHNYGYYNAEDMKQIDRVFDWSLHNIYTLSPRGWHFHNVEDLTTAQIARDHLTTGTEQKERWFSGRITNGDLGNYIKIPYTFDWENGSSVGNIEKGRGFRNSFGIYNLAYNQVMYPIPFGGSPYDNVSDTYEDRNENDIVEPNERRHGRKFTYRFNHHDGKHGKYFKIPYRRISPATFASPVTRKQGDTAYYANGLDNAGNEPAYNYVEWNDNRSDLSAHDFTTDQGVRAARNQIKNKYRDLWKAQEWYAKHKLPPLTFFQKNLRKNHYHSPNQVRTPLRLFFTKIDYYYEGQLEQGKSRLLFAYDIPHVLKGAKTKYDSNSNKLEPVHSPYRKHLLQEGLTSACREYLDYSKLERFAMRMPNNGSNHHKTLDKEASNALSLTWYTPHPVFMNDPVGFYGEDQDLTKNFPSGGGLAYYKTKNATRLINLRDGAGNKFKYISRDNKKLFTWNSSKSLPLINPGITNVTWAVDRRPEDSSRYGRYKIPRRRIKKGTGLYYLDRVSKALHGELIDYDYNPALPEGVGDARFAVFNNTQANNYKGATDSHREALTDQLNAIFFSNCGIPHGGPYVYSTHHLDPETFEYGNDTQGSFSPGGDRSGHMYTHFNARTCLAFVRDLDNKSENAVNLEFERSLSNRFGQNWMVNPDGHFEGRDTEDPAQIAKHRAPGAAYFVNNTGPHGGANRITGHSDLSPQDRHRSFVKNPYKTIYSMNGKSSVALRDYTHAPTAGSYFYNPTKRGFDLNREPGSLLESKSPTSYANQLNLIKYMVEPFMSFAGHTNLMSRHYLENQIDYGSLSEGSESWRNINDSEKGMIAQQFEIPKGFATVAKIYSLAAHREVYEGYGTSTYEITEYSDSQEGQDGATPPWGPSEDGRTLNSFMIKGEFIDAQFFSLQSIELTDTEISPNSNFCLNMLAGGFKQKVPFFTDLPTFIHNNQESQSGGIRGDVLSSQATYVAPEYYGADRKPQIIEKQIYENFPTILYHEHFDSPGSLAPENQHIIRNAIDCVPSAAQYSEDAASEESMQEWGIAFRQLINHTIKNVVASKDEFSAWARMSCPAWLSGETPDSKYLENSKFFIGQSNKSYMPVQLLPNTKIENGKITRWRDLMEPSPITEENLGQMGFNLPNRLPVRLGDYSAPNLDGPLTATTTRRSELPFRRTGVMLYNSSMMDNATKTAKNILSDQSTQLPLEIREKINDLLTLNQLGEQSSVLIDRLERSIFGKEGGQEASEIYSGLRLVKIMPSHADVMGRTSGMGGISTEQAPWVYSGFLSNAENAEKLERAHLTERSFYINLKDELTTGDNLLLHLPIHSVEKAICLPGPPDGFNFQDMSAAQLGSYLSEALNMESDIIRQCISHNHQAMVESPIFNLLSNYVYPTNEAQAAAAIYSTMALTSQDKMYKLLRPTKNAFLNIINSIGNKVQDETSGIWTAPPPMSNAEYEVFLKNVGTGGPRIPCGGVPGFDAEEFLERILDLIIQLPASILTTLAMLLDPGYRVMHQRFTSCSPADQHIKSLDWGAVATATEYGWGVPVGGKGALSQGTLEGNVPKGGKFANVLYSFPVDLFAGLTFVMGPPFVFFNPSFGMAFVKLANYILGSVGVGSGAGGGINTPCFGADMDADASVSLLDGKNGYGHPLLLFGPLALTVNSWPFLRLPADDPSEQRKLCRSLPGAPGRFGDPALGLNNRINSACDPDE